MNKSEGKRDEREECKKRKIAFKRARIWVGKGVCVCVKDKDEDEKREREGVRDSDNNLGERKRVK